MRIAVLTSSAGGDFLALLKAQEVGLFKKLDFQLLISTTSNSTSLEKAKENHIPTHFINMKADSRIVVDSLIEKIILKALPDLICLCGYKYLLQKNIVSMFAGRIINSHPSLLPAFPGIIQKETMLRSNVKILGATVHIVNEEMDNGPQIIQAAFANPTLHDLATALKLYRKIQDVLYVQAVRWFENSFSKETCLPNATSFFHEGILYVPAIDDDIKKIFIDNN